MYGSEAYHAGTYTPGEFESSVILYGSEAISISYGTYLMFESSVILYGSEAQPARDPVHV